MTLHQLRIFDVVAQHLNITKASAELHISQPSVFQQLKSLEESCGLRLYRKVSRGIELTAAGEKLQAEAREILERVETLQRKFDARRRSPELETLLVGGAPVPSKSVLPLCLATFKRAHPLARVKLQTENSRTIERLVQNSELEIAVVSGTSNLSELEYVPFRDERIVLFVSTRHPLARKSGLNLAEIADGPLIVHRGIRRGTEKSVHLRLFRRGRATLDILKRIEEEGRSPNILMECSSSEAVKAAVMRGLGLGILIQAHLENEIRRGEVKILKISECDDFLVPSFVIYQKDKPLSDNAKEFLRLLKRSARLSAQREIRSPSTNHISA